ncbi:hypothetical protein UPYG_G00273620 [Umbra pygmaea]|uniref:SH2 domain-containing protein n=1 Tax=Umbra pygmaea TaxID=75934 RepID=A0ABD0WG90_UMBPY
MSTCIYQMCSKSYFFTIVLEKTVQLSAMTLGSHHNILPRLCSPTGTSKVTSHHRSHYSLLPGARFMVLAKHPKTYSFRNTLMFRHKERARMDQRQVPSAVNSQMDQGTEARLRDMALKWFRETQAPLILHEGNFPSWFLGFISRRDAEETLQDKEVGCFLIRLSDKAIGYILSYRGRDRCRHFVINQTTSGQFVVSGDIEEHATLTDLIEHYKTSPIQPFGEHLTYCYLESSSNEVYDVVKVNAKEKPVVCVRAVRNLWDQLSDQQQGQRSMARQSDQNWKQPSPDLPSKSLRKQEEVTKVTNVWRKSSPLKSSSLDDQQGGSQSRVLYAKLEKHQHRSLEGQPRDPEGLLPVAHHQCPQMETVSRERAPEPGTVYSELLDCRSKSLPVLDLDQSSSNPTKQPMDRATTPTLLEQDYHLDQSSRASSRPSTQGHSLDYLCDKPAPSPSFLYHLAGSATDVGRSMTSSRNSPQQEAESLYSEVPREPVLRLLLDNTYEQIPEQGLKGSNCLSTNNHTYESVAELKSKCTATSWGMKTEKRRWMFPERQKK